jgi:hypothetical protein
MDDRSSRFLDAFAAIEGHLRKLVWQWSSNPGPPEAPMVK